MITLRFKFSESLEWDNCCIAQGGKIWQSEWDRALKILSSKSVKFTDKTWKLTNYKVVKIMFYGF
jgi:hypothetical protein